MWARQPYITTRTRHTTMPKRQPDSGSFIQLYRTEGTSKKSFWDQHIIILYLTFQKNYCRTFSVGKTENSPNGQIPIGTDTRTAQKSFESLELQRKQQGKA